MAQVVVVGGGLSGLSFAWFLRKEQPVWEVQVLEAEKRPGGKAWTVEEEGFLCEAGVNGVLDNKPSTLALADRLGVTPVRSNDAARKRFVVKDGRLVPLPDSLPAFLSSHLISRWGRLRIFAEMFLPRGDLSQDESLADFARRRLGREAFEQLIDPMATGIFAGDPERLSLRSCFPRIYELERDYGSLIRAMLRMQITARRKGKAGPGAGPGGTLTSFAGGMGGLVASVSHDLGPRLRLSAHVTEVVRHGDRWQVGLEGGEVIEASHVVLACPAPVVARVLVHSAPEVAELAAQVSYPSISVVCLGVREKGLSRPLDGFGFLVPGRERRHILGTLWDSAIFPERAPAGYVLLRTLVGGARASNVAALPDNSLVDLVREELEELMDMRVQPDFVKVFRWREAIPQYEVGHQDRMKRLDEALKRYPGLFIRCNWVGGVSLNDCVANSEALAQRLGGL